MSDAGRERAPFGAVALTVSYDGEPFSGFARQPGQDTVQGRLESALATVLRREVVTVGAGRTDAGVHALGQVVSFDAEGDEPIGSLARSLTALAGPGIVVRARDPLGRGSRRGSTRSHASIATALSPRPRRRSS